MASIAKLKAARRVRMANLVDGVCGSIAREHLFPVDEDALCSVDEPHRRTGLGGTDGDGDLVAGLEGGLRPSGFPQNARAVHLDRPVDDFPARVLHVEIKRGMRITECELGDHSAERDRFGAVVRAGAVMGGEGKRYRARLDFYPRNRRYPKMKTWTRPDFEEVNLACEINCYAPAER